VSTEPIFTGDLARASQADRTHLVVSKGAVENMSGDVTLTCRDCGQGFSFYRR
jgi:hypothetical protein